MHLKKVVNNEKTDFFYTLPVGGSGHSVSGSKFTERQIFKR
jgi:hypothetical protein